jgi:NADPH-dependent 2,4-dienoyl-CoA reductase/sulfur reductase-like enzyme
LHLVVVGGSDAGVSAALRARRVTPSAEVTLVSAEPVASFSASGIPFFLSGEVPDAGRLADPTASGLASSDVEQILESTVHSVDAQARKVLVLDSKGNESTLAYDELILATGAIPRVPDIEGLSGEDALRAEDGVHAVRSATDTLAVARTLSRIEPQTAVVIGGGYVGVELAEALALRGMSVTLLESRQEVLSVVDRRMGALVRGQLEERGVEVLTGTLARSIGATGMEDGRFRIEAMRGENLLARRADMVLLSAGNVPNSALARSIGAKLAQSGAVSVDGGMRCSIPHVFAAGDCAVTHHRLLGESYLPYGTTANKQGRVAGENAAGGSTTFAGTLGTQLVKVFDHAIGRTGLIDSQATEAGFEPLTVYLETDDRSSYYPGSRQLSVMLTADRRTRRLIGAQFFGHVRSEIAGRVDIASAAIFNGMTVDHLEDLDLSYTPPLGQVWHPLVRAADIWRDSPA